MCQMLHNDQDKFTKETTHLQGLHQVPSILDEQFCLFLAQVLSLQTMILTRRILPLLILLQLIDLLFLLTYGQNPIRAIILMNSWPTYLMLIRLLDLILFQEKLKSVFPTSLVALSLTSSIISCDNVTYISVLIQHNSTQTLQE